MRFLLLAMLVACATKPKQPPPIDKLDRSCTVDTDCTLAVGICCTGCGGHIGEPVNAKAWAATTDVRNAECAKHQCPDYNCEKPPDCREEPRAVCQAGRCERVMEKTAACAVDAKLACTSKADCRLVTRGDDCCDRCEGTAMNATAATIENERVSQKCATKIVKCPHLDCPAIGVDCVGGKCVTTP